MKEQFLNNIAEHVMTVEMDNGVHRCLKFGKPSSVHMYFRLTTWPGHLCISGDMGTYVFARLTDMFQFFRREDGELKINTDYWMEKLEAISCFGSSDGKVLEYDPEGTVESVKNWLNDEEQVQMYAEELEEIAETFNQQEALRIIDSINGLSDGWKCIRTRPTFYIQWCLYAIAWGIQKYDELNSKQEAA